MRSTVFASALMLASGAVIPAFAQDAAPSGSFDAESAVKGFLTDAALLGADVATVERVTTDGDTVIAEGVTMRWQVAIDAPQGGGVVDASAGIETLRITGLTATDGGYTASNIFSPKIELSISGKDVETGTTDGSVSPDTTDTAASAEEPAGFQYDTTLVDYGMTDVSWRDFPRISGDPSKPVSRFAPLLDWSVEMSYRENSVGRVETHLVAGGETQDSTYGPFTFGPYADGRIEEIKYPAFAVDQQTEMPALPGEDGETDEGGTKTVNLHAEYGEIVATGIDMRPYIQLLTGNGELNGPSPVIDGFKMDGVSISFDDSAMGGFSMGEIAGNGFTIDPSVGPLLEKFDGLVATILADGEPDPMMPMMLALDIYGALGVGGYTINDMAFSGEGMSAKVGEIAVADVSSAGMGRVAVSGATIEGDGRTGSLDTAEISGIVFPSREAFMNAMIGGMMGMPFSAENMDALPTLGGLKVAGLYAQLPGDTGEEVKLDLFDLALTNYIKGIPTNIAMTLDGFSMPVSQLNAMPAKMVLNSIGVEQINADSKLELAWNEDSQTVSLNDRMSVEGVGNFSAAAELSGIPRTLFENVMQAQQAIATAAVGDITVRFEDEGIVPAVLGMFAQMSGASPEEFADGIAAQAEMQIGMIAGPELGAKAGEALRTFLADPESLTITADPDAAVPVAQLVGAAMTAPAQIANILKLSITAND